MRIRYKDKPHITGHASRFNLHSVSEVIVQFDDGDATSEYIRELEVFLEGSLQRWMPLRDAFKSGNVVTDEYNTQFFQHPA